MSRARPDEGPEAARARSGLRAALALALLALLAWMPAAVRAGFSFDDREAVEQNPAVEGSLPWTAAFERDYWEHRGAAGHYRPLATLTLRIDRALWGERASGFHATNVLLHALTVFAAALLLQRLVRSGERWPWIGLAVFAVHPVLADSVAWISGRSSMLSALFGLAAALGLAWKSAPLRGMPALAGCAALGFAGTALAFLGKEDGLLWALVLPCIAARRGRAAWIATFAGALAAVEAVFALRAHALGSPWISAPHAPLADETLGTRLTVAGRAALEALRLSAWPASYAPTYTGDPAFDPATVRAAPALGLLGLALFASAAVAAVVLLRRRTLAAASLAFGLAAWIPFLQLVPTGEVFAPRFLYLPLLFAAPFVHSACTAVFGSRAALPCAAALALLVPAAWVRGRVYASRAAFRLEVLAHRPDDVASWNDLGLAHEEQGRLDEARAAWRRATELDPRYSRAWSNLGRAALQEGRTEEALELLERAAREGPANPVAHLNLGSARMASGDPRAAEASYRAALALAPGLARAWEGLTRALFAQQRDGEARAALARWLELEPSNPRALAESR